MRSRVAAASVARRPSSSQTTTRVPWYGTRRRIRNSNSRRGTRLVSGICVLLYSPGSRTSMQAQVACVCSMCLRSAGVIGCAMTFLQHHTSRSHQLRSLFLWKRGRVVLLQCMRGIISHTGERLQSSSGGPRESSPGTPLPRCAILVPMGHNTSDNTSRRVRAKEYAMHVGYAPMFQNPGNALPDAEVYRQEL